MKKAHTPDRRDGWYEITPAEAITVFENRRKNRHLNQSHAEFLAADMKQKKWEANGEALIFDPEGHLLDGQHRVRAVVLANTSITTYCVFGVRPALFDTMDQGKARTATDLATISRMKNSQFCAQIAKYSINSNDGHEIVNSGGRVKGWLIDDYYKKYGADIEASAHLISTLQKKLNTIGATCGICAFVYHIAKKQDAEKAERFMRELASGEDLKSGSPVLALRNKLITRENGHPLGREAKIQSVIKAWCLYRDNVKTTKIVLKTEKYTMYSDLT